MFALRRVARGVDDIERADRALKGVIGKRLTYRATDRAPADSLL